ncbi:MAG: hypothetical protein NTZ10_06030 [Candidatus Saganbacteria bacterium]|nr:hypothetical protein [Candidatus Saganbacteria bacterium]
MAAGTLRFKISDKVMGTLGYANRTCLANHLRTIPQAQHAATITALTRNRLLPAGTPTTLNLTTLDASLLSSTITPDKLLRVGITLPDVSTIFAQPLRDRNWYRSACSYGVAAAGMAAGMYYCNDLNQYFNTELFTPFTVALSEAAAGLALKLVNRLKPGTEIKSLADSFTTLGIAGILANSDYGKELWTSKWDAIKLSWGTAEGKLGILMASFGTTAVASTLLKMKYYLKSASTLYTSEALPSSLRWLDSTGMKIFEALGWTSIITGMGLLYHNTGVGYDYMNYLYDQYINSPLSAIWGSNVGKAGSAALLGGFILDKLASNSRTITSKLGAAANNRLIKFSKYVQLAGIGAIFSSLPAGTKTWEGAKEVMKGFVDYKNTEWFAASWMATLTALSFISIGRLKKADPNGFMYKAYTLGTRLYPWLIGLDAVGLGLWARENNGQLSPILTLAGENTKTFLEAAGITGFSSWVLGKIKASDNSRLSAARNVPSRLANRLVHSMTSASKAAQSNYLLMMYSLSAAHVFTLASSLCQPEFWNNLAYISGPAGLLQMYLLYKARWQDAHQTGSAIGAQQDIGRCLDRENLVHATDEELLKIGGTCRSPQVLINNPIINPRLNDPSRVLHRFYGRRSLPVITMPELKPEGEEINQIKRTFEIDTAAENKKQELLARPALVAYESFKNWAAALNGRAPARQELEVQYNILIGHLYRYFEVLYPYVEGEGRALINQHYASIGHNPTNELGAVWTWFSSRQNNYFGTPDPRTQDSCEANWLTNMRALILMHEFDVLRTIQEIESAAANPNYELSLNELRECYLDLIDRCTTENITNFRRKDRLEYFTAKAAKSPQLVKLNLQNVLVTIETIEPSLTVDRVDRAPVEGSEAVVRNPFYDPQR